MTQPGFALAPDVIAATRGATHAHTNIRQGVEFDGRGADSRRDCTPRIGAPGHHGGHGRSPISRHASEIDSTSAPRPESIRNNSHLWTSAAAHGRLSPLDILQRAMSHRLFFFSHFLSESRCPPPDEKSRMKSGRAFSGKCSSRSCHRSFIRQRQGPAGLGAQCASSSTPARGNEQRRRESINNQVVGLFPTPQSCGSRTAPRSQPDRPSRQ